MIKRKSKITGDTATVTIPNSAPKHLVRAGTIWRIDESAEYSDDSNVEAKARMFDAMAGVAGGLAREVEQGQYQSAFEARAALQKRVFAAMKR